MWSAGALCFSCIYIGHIVIIIDSVYVLGGYLSPLNNSEYCPAYSQLLPKLDLPLIIFLSVFTPIVDTNHK